MYKISDFSSSVDHVQTEASDSLSVEQVQTEVSDYLSQ